MLYVFEGSALGGNVLQKMLSRKAMITPKLGTSFFEPHGDDPNARWRYYVRLLLHLSTTANVEKAIVNGAVATFNALQNWIVEGASAIRLQCALSRDSYLTAPLGQSAFI